MDSGRAPKADLAWHVRAWGQWVLDQARARSRPLLPDLCRLRTARLEEPQAYETQPMRFVPLKDDGTPNIDAL